MVTQDTRFGLLTWFCLEHTQASFVEGMFMSLSSMAKLLTLDRLQEEQRLYQASSGLI